MLDPWIIEQIRRREEEQRQHREQPVLEVPRETPWGPADPERDRQGDGQGEEAPRGVVIIDYGASAA